MDSRTYEQARQLYHELADVPRADALANLAERNLSPEVRRLATSLLGHDSSLKAFDEEHMGQVGIALVDSSVEAGDSSEPESRASGLLPERIGGFRVLDVLGRGGMGVVYRGVQEKPEREVAIKVLQFIAANPNTLRRFEYEAQILARLDHPYVATIIEAGVDSDLGGLPFIVMELVPGVDLIEHCEALGLGTREKLMLFQRICQGVEHAHQRSIVHRDLKPANILVDREGRPRILDFGIARPATDDQSTPGKTESGSVLGSLSWMSPEQARGDLNAVDVRSDVYALGVILYRLLSGRMPYDLEGVPPWDAARIICEKEPARLGLERHDLRGDLEAIVGRTLEKDPEKRYSGAGALDRDLGRYLDDQPVEARPWSASYQFSKFARRHRWLVTAFALTFASVTVGLVSSVLLWRDAETAREEAEHERGVAEAERKLAISARNAADDARGVAEEARQRADAEAERARRKAETSEQVVSFLRNMFHRAIDSQVSGQEVTVKEVLDRAVPTIEDRLHSEPAIRAELMHTMGGVYSQLGFLSQANVLLEDAVALQVASLPEDDEQRLSTLLLLAKTKWKLGRLDSAQAWFEEGIPRCDRVFGPEDPRTAVALRCYGNLLLEQGRYAEAEPLLLRGIEISKSHSAKLDSPTLELLMTLTSLYHQRGDPGKALPLGIETFEGLQALYGPDHHLTLVMANNLSVIHLELGNLDKAEKLAVANLEGHRRALGEEHPNTLLVQRNLGNLYRRLNRFAEAEELLFDALEGLESSLGEGHQHVLTTKFVLADMVQQMGRTEDAIPLAWEILSAREELLGYDHRDTIETLCRLGEWHERSDPGEAEALFRDATERSIRASARGGLHMRDALVGLGRVLREREAESELTELLEGFRDQLSEIHDDDSEAMREFEALCDEIRPIR